MDRPRHHGIEPFYDRLAQGFENCMKRHSFAACSHCCLAVAVLVVALFKPRIQDFAGMLDLTLTVTLSLGRDGKPSHNFKTKGATTHFPGATQWRMR